MNIINTSLQLLQRRKEALNIIDWPEEEKKRWRDIMTTDYMSSEEEIEATPGRPSQKMKKYITWQSRRLRAGKDELDKCHFVKAGPKTKNAMTKYVGLGTYSESQPPPDAPLWTLK